MKETPLTNGQSTKVDGEDYEYLSRYSWYAFVSKKTFAFPSFSVILCA